MSTAPAIEAEGLVKRYGTTTAVDGVSLSAETGSVLGLLGPNGAGKTTVVRMLATLLRPDAGSARICGHDVAERGHEARRMLGATGQYASVDLALSGVQNLVMVGRLLGLPRRAARSRAAELLADAGLSDVGHRTARTYSGGMRRRLDLVMSLVNRPAVMFLDEPTTGLDPAHREDTWAVIRSLAAQGTTVLLTTQYLEEADRLADRIVVMDGGAVVAEGTPDALKRRLGTRTLDLQVADRSMLGVARERLGTMVASTPVVDRDGLRLTVAITTSVSMAAVVQTLDDAGVRVEELHLRLPTLDDVFLALTRPHRTTASAGTPGVAGDVR